MLLRSQTGEYALRAMAWLAIVSPEAPVTALDLSRGTGIPAHYLSKVLRRLVRAGLLASRKGMGGGFVLARPPETIRFIDILGAVDVLPPANRCAFGWGACDSSAPCPLHDSWGRIYELFSDWASATTLAQVRASPIPEPRPTAAG